MKKEEMGEYILHSDGEKVVYATKDRDRLDYLRTWEKEFGNIEKIIRTTPSINNRMFHGRMKIYYSCTDKGKLLWWPSPKLTKDQYDIR